MTEHYCKAVDHPKALIKCIGVPDSNKWLDLVWWDGSRLLVKYCPFCGQKASGDITEKPEIFTTCA